MNCCTKCTDTSSVDQFPSRATEFSDSLSRLSISSPLGSDVAYLINVDADLHMPTDDNFSYLSTHDFHSNHDIAECFINGQAFSVIHCNIRSLSANYDNLAHMLSELYFPFSIIGLTETKIKDDQTLIMNIDLPGYSFISQPTLSNAGGAAFYISNGLRFTMLSEYSVTTEDFESLWIEIHNPHKSNLL